MAAEAGRFITHLATPLPKDIRDLYEYTNPDQFTKQSDEELARHIEGVRNQACEYLVAVGYKYRMVDLLFSDRQDCTVAMYR